jgi:hypothetical protein
MRLIYPEEIKELKKIYKPYIVNCKLREDAPQKVIDAFNAVKKWVDEQYRLAGME